MQPTKTLRVLVALSGLIALAIGASILIDPAGFHAAHDIELGSSASLMSEVRAPGGALLGLGLLMLVGAFQRALTFTAGILAAAVYLAYGVSRLLSVVLAGVPHEGLVGATAIELVLGGACAVALLHSARGSGPRRSRCTLAG